MTRRGILQLFQTRKQAHGPLRQHGAHTQRSALTFWETRRSLIKRLVAVQVVKKTPPQPNKHICESNDTEIVDLQIKSTVTTFAEFVPESKALTPPHAASSSAHTLRGRLARLCDTRTPHLKHKQSLAAPVPTIKGWLSNPVALSPPLITARPLSTLAQDSGRVPPRSLQLCAHNNSPAG